METTEKKDNSSDNQTLNKKNNRYYKLLCVLVVILSLLFIVDILYKLTSDANPTVRSEVYRFGKDSNYVIYHYDAEEKFIGKDSVVFIK